MVLIDEAREDEEEDDEDWSAVEQLAKVHEILLKHVPKRKEES